MSLAQLTEDSAILTSPVPKLEISSSSLAYLPSTTRWCAMCWAMHTGANNDVYQDLIAYSDNNEVIGMGLKLVTGNRFLNLGDLNTDNVGTKAVANNEWHHYALTVQPSGVATKCYGWLDGKLEVTATLNQPSGALPYYLRLMNSRASITDAGAVWVGRVCAFKIWDGYALDGDDVQKEMQFYAPQTNLPWLWTWTPCYDAGSCKEMFGGRGLINDWTVGGTSFLSTGPDPPGVKPDAPLTRRRTARYFVVPPPTNPPGLRTTLQAVERAGFF